MRKGFTLIELVIAIMIFSIIIAPTIIFFNQTIKNFTYGKPDSKTVEVVTDAINEIESLLRQANSVGIAEANKIGFIIPKSGGERKITFDLINGFIQRTDDFGTKYTPYYNSPNTPLSEVVNLELSFRYFDKNNNLLPYGVPDQVRVVEIAIKGSPKEIPQGMTNSEFELQTMVKLRNVK